MWAERAFPFLPIDRQRELPSSYRAERALPRAELTNQKKPPAFSFHIILGLDYLRRIPFLSSLSLFFFSFALHDKYYRNDTRSLLKKKKRKYRKAKFLK